MSGVDLLGGLFLVGFGIVRSRRLVGGKALSGPRGRTGSAQPPRTRNGTIWFVGQLAEVLVLVFFGFRMLAAGLPLSPDAIVTIRALLGWGITLGLVIGIPAQIIDYVQKQRNRTGGGIAR